MLRRVRNGHPRPKVAPGIARGRGSGGVGGGGKGQWWRGAFVGAVSALAVSLLLLGGGGKGGGGGVDSVQEHEAQEARSERCPVSSL